MKLFEKAGLCRLRALVMMGWWIFILNGVPVAMAQWVSHGPPGAVNAIAIDPQTPTTLYAGTSGVDWTHPAIGQWGILQRWN